MKSLVLALGLLVSASSYAESKTVCTVAVTDGETFFSEGDDRLSLPKQYQMLISDLEKKHYSIVSPEKADLIFLNLNLNADYNPTATRVKSYSPMIDYKFKKETPGLTGLGGSLTWYKGDFLPAKNLKNEIAEKRAFVGKDESLFWDASLEKALNQALQKIPNCQ